jgi:AsmA protein
MGPRPLRRVRVPVRHAPQRRWLPLVGYAGLGLASLALGALTFLFFAAPTDLVRERLVQQLKAGSGREVVIAGATSVSFFPRLAVTVANVSLSAPSDGSGPALAVERLDAELGLWSLFGGEPKIARVVLTRPSLLLADAALPLGGERGTAPTPPARFAARPGRGARPPAPSAAAARAMGLESVRIIDGRLSAREGASALLPIGELNVDIALSPGAGPLNAKGSFLLRGEKVAFAGTLASLATLLEEGAVHLALKVAGRPGEATFDGEVSGGNAVDVQGRFEVAAPSLRALTAFLGAQAEGLEAGALRLAGTVAAAHGQISLSPLEGAVGETALAGAVSLERKGERPFMRGELRLGELDFGRLLLRPAAAAAPVAAPGGAAAARSDGARSDGARAQGDWSDDIIDLTPLALGDADLALSVDRVVFKQFATGPSRLTVAVERQFAKVTLEDIELYGGRGQGVVTLDGSHKTPAVGVNATLAGVSALPLLKDALGFEWLEGRGSISLALAGQGVTERQVISGLNGKLALAISNGAVNGADASKILRAVEHGRLGDLSVAPADKTPFSEFAAAFLVTSGVAQNQDLRLISPRVQVNGAGSVGLAQRTIDYTARTRIIAGAPSPGAIVNIANLEIPVRIQGPWSKPSLGLAGQDNLAETVKQIGKNLSTPEVQEAIKGLLGGDTQRIKPGDLLDKLLKKP